MQRLYEAACTVQQLVATVPQFATMDSIKSLCQCADDLAALAAENDRLEHVRAKARELYRHGEDIEIDRDALAHHNGSNGYWVGAWLWVHEDAVGPPPEPAAPIAPTPASSPPGRKMRTVEYCACWQDRTWTTDFMDVPYDTPEDKIEDALRAAALRTDWGPRGGPVLISLYHIPPDDEEDT